MPQLHRNHSLERSHDLVARARRKSTDKVVQEDLRLRLAHTNVLDSALKDIAARSPPPSPTQSVCTPHRKTPSIKWATQVIVSHVEEGDYDDYGFRYDDDGEEDINSLALTRTVTRKPKR